MPEREDANASDRCDRFLAAFRQRDRERHQAEAGRSNQERKNEAMLDPPAAERKRSEDGSNREPDFMDDWLSQDAADGRQETHHDSSRQAMDEAKPRQAHRQPVQPSRFCKFRCHRVADISEASSRYNITLLLL